MNLKALGSFIAGLLVLCVAEKATPRNPRESGHSIRGIALWRQHYDRGAHLYRGM
jgi:hypothetical protein